jgi:Tfp pilus assembly protein PilX
VVLIVALLLLLVISVGSTVGVRLAMNSSAIATGLRGANEAQQAADLALRWCELQVRLIVSGQPAVANPDNFNLIGKGRAKDTDWQDFNNFNNNARPIPAAVMAAAGIPAIPPPLCMAMESDAWAGTPEDDKNKTGVNSSWPEYRSFQITVRGMSRDFVEGTNGEDRGSEVWLQSNLAVSARN